MNQLIIEKLNRQPDKVISVSGNQASFFPSGQRKLLQVGCLGHIVFMRTDAVKTLLLEQVRDPGAQIFIQVIFHL